MQMAKNSRVAALPVLDPELGNRIRQVVDMFDRKKDAAQVAGVIPEQLNRWCQAQSEPRFVGVARLACAQAVRLEWIVTGKGPVHIDLANETPKQPNRYSARSAPSTRLLPGSSQSNTHAAGHPENIGSGINSSQVPPQTPPLPHNDRGLLSAIVTGFLTAEGVENAPRITQDILAAYNEIVTLLGEELNKADTGLIIAQIVSAIIRRHSIPNRQGTGENAGS
jgi:DNA-binding phage protein